MSQDNNGFDLFTEPFAEVTTEGFDWGSYEVPNICPNDFRDNTTTEVPICVVCRTTVDVWEFLCTLHDARHYLPQPTGETPRVDR